VLETLLSLTSKQAGDWFKDSLRTLGGLNQLVSTGLSLSLSLCVFLSLSLSLSLCLSVSVPCVCVLRSVSCVSVCFCDVCRSESLCGFAGFSSSQFSATDGTAASCRTLHPRPGKSQSHTSVVFTYRSLSSSSSLVSASLTSIKT